MKKTLLLGLIFLIIAILVVFLWRYLSVFNPNLSFSNLSLNHSDWGSFGSYFAGTIGTCFSLLGITLLYYTFYEQRKQQFENAFQQYISNYYSLLNLVKERWLHNASDNGRPIYQNGREIFGNAVGEIDIYDAKNQFIKIFSIHNNVFQHYCTYLIELFEIIENNNELKKKTKERYINRFLSMLSTYELTFFAYFIKYLYTNENSKKNNRHFPKNSLPIIKGIDPPSPWSDCKNWYFDLWKSPKHSKKIKKQSEKIKGHLQTKLENLELTCLVPHKEQIQFIIKELK